MCYKKSANRGYQTCGSMVTAILPNLNYIYINGW